jgi:hypothetical protein
MSGVARHRLPKEPAGADIAQERGRFLVDVVSAVALSPYLRHLISTPFDVDACRILCFQAGFWLEIDHLLRWLMCFKGGT